MLESESPVFLQAMVRRLSLGAEFIENIKGGPGNTANFEWVHAIHMRRKLTDLIDSSTAVPAYAILKHHGASMIDPTQLPILLKAIDFVFDEGRKILEERRERRKMNDNSEDSKNQEPEKEIIPLEPEKESEIKQDLLASRIDEILWQNHELEVKHLVRLLETYSRNYQLAREQYAKWGSALVPPIIVNNMREAENSMIETIKQLEIILSKVYKKEVNPIR